VSGGVLVTGFPNVTSRVLVRRLLSPAADLPSTLFLLTPTQAEADAQGFISQLDPMLARRIVPIGVRLGAIDLGLSGQEYRQLANQVSVIHHTAPSVAPNADRDRVQQLNIGATREIIEFARVVTEIESLIFYSSVLVSGESSGPVAEQEITSPRGFRCPAERALATAERMIFAAMDRVPITVLRAGLLSCDSRTGEAERDSPLAQLVSFLVRSRRDWPVFMPGRGHLPLWIVPIDYLVEVALCVARRTDSLGKVFHIVDPHPPAVEQVFNLVRGDAAPTRNLPLGLGRALFNAPGPLSWANTPRMLLDLMTSEVTFETTNTDAVLADTGLVCPQFDNYLARFTDHLQAGHQTGRSQEAGRRRARPERVS